VQHVGVRQYQIRFAANAATLGGGGVAIVDAGPNGGGEFGVAAGEFEQALELVLGKGFGGVEVESPRGR
jgi:hypothetical protein